MKKYNDKPNLVGNLIRKYRIQNNYSKAALSRKLQLLGIDLGGTEIKRIEDNKQILKDFELIGFIKILNIDLKAILDLLD